MNDVVQACPSRLGLLLRVKVRSISNRTLQAVKEAPVRLSATVLLVGVIWLGLYVMFWAVFDQFRRTPLEATVAMPLLFNVFFATMLVLLTFSNAIIVYSGMFGRSESAYLFAAPVAPLDIVTLKYLESLILASWSLILLGLPLMLVLADVADRSMAITNPIGSVAFYCLFLAFFLAFIPIPASLGLLLAWATARFFPRSALRTTVVFAGMGLAVATVWGMHALRLGDSDTEAWLHAFLANMSFIQSALLPNHWVASGIDHAIHHQLPPALLYLGVTAANAFFLSWVAVRVVAADFSPAHNRAWTGRGASSRRPSSMAGGLGMVFFYLPSRLRLIATKDLRTFLRDPLQWSQLVILFGLLILYLTTLPGLRQRLAGTNWFMVVPFLNLCAVSLILATFTCRFVFPLVSLEGQKLWLIGLLPMKRGHVLWAKFSFAMTVTLLVALTATIIPTIVLGLEFAWALIHLVITISICFGLCGFAVGIGARMPMFEQTNAARIANGLGGTTNLLASVGLIAVSLTGVGVATWRSEVLMGGAPPDAIAILYCSGAALLSIAAGATAMWIGAQHFNRVEL